MNRNFRRQGKPWPGESAFHTARQARALPPPATGHLMMSWPAGAFEGQRSISAQSVCKVVVALLNGDHEDTGRAAARSAIIVSNFNPGTTSSISQQCPLNARQSDKLGTTVTQKSKPTATIPRWRGRSTKANSAVSIPGQPLQYPSHYHYHSVTVTTTWRHWHLLLFNRSHLMLIMLSGGLPGHTRRSAPLVFPTLVTNEIVNTPWDFVA